MLDDDLVVHRKDDRIARSLEREHGVDQEFAGESRGHVLGQLPAIGRDLAPLPLAVGVVDQRGRPHLSWPSIRAFA